MLSWNVFFEDFNSKQIVNRDIFKGGKLEEFCVNLKKSTLTKQQFAEELRKELMYHYWARSEYEIVLTSWPPYIKTEDVYELAHDIQENKEQYNTTPVRVCVNPTVARKVDIYEQIQMNWDVFVDYVYNNV